MLFGFHSTFAIFCILLVISLPEPDAAEEAGATPGGGDAATAAGGNSEAASAPAEAASAPAEAASAPAAEAPVEVSPAAQQAAATSQVPVKAKGSSTITLSIGLETISLFLALYLGL